jgi:hypothetical protein
MISRQNWNSLTESWHSLATLLAVSRWDFALTALTMVIGTASLILAVTISTHFSA